MTQKKNKLRTVEENRTEKLKAIIKATKAQAASD